MSLHSQDKLTFKLRDRDYRSAFVSSRINNFLAFQIRALRQKKKWSQIELAKRLGTSQNAVSRMENPSYGKHSITTLKRLGEIFDVGVIVWFAPFSELIKRAVDLSTENVIVPSFEEEFGAAGQKNVEFEREEKEQPAIPPEWAAFRRFLSESKGMSPADLINNPRGMNIVMQLSIPSGIEPQILQPESLGEEGDYGKKLLVPKQTLRRDTLIPSNSSASGSQAKPI